MALLFAVGGALLGNALGIGANIGWIVGAVVGTLLFPPEQASTSTEGPRLGDLTVTSSAYGAPRALGFGTVRMGGNVIFANEIREEKRTRTVSSGGKGKGGKGGSEQKITEYYYYGTWTVAFGEGTARTIRRIWADGKLVFDKRGQTVKTRKKDWRFRFYLGTEDQGRDPVHTAKHGAASTPAYRGTVMIVFDDCALKDFGNRLPNITAEIVYEAPLSRATAVSTGAPAGIASYDGNKIGIDWERNFAYVFATRSGDGEVGIAKINLVNNNVELVRYGDELFASGGYVTGGQTVTAFRTEVLHCLPNGNLFVNVDTDNISGTNSTPVIALDASLTPNGNFFGTKNNSLSPSPTNIPQMNSVTSNRSLGTGQIFVFCDTLLAIQPIILKLGSNGLEYVFDNDTAGYYQTTALGRKASPINGRQGEGFVEFWQCQTPIGTSALNIPLYRYRVEENTTYTTVDSDDVFSGISAGAWREFTVAEIDATWTVFGNGSGNGVYDAANDRVLLFFNDGNVDTRLISYDYNTDTIIWNTVLGNGLNSNTGISQSVLRNNTFGYVRANRGYQVNTVTGEILENNDLGVFDRSLESGSIGAYHSPSERFVGIYADTDGAPIVTMFFNRFDAGGQTLSSIVAGIIERVGLTSADYSVADLSTITVPGYYIGRQTSARAAIEPLQSFFLFDGVESDHTLKFFERGNSSIRTITQDELAVVDDQSGDVYRENRTQEQELPESFSITYMDEARDYQQAHHTARRILEPTPSMGSRNNLGIQLNAVLTPERAKRQAEKALYSAWIERANFNMKTSWKHIDLDPSDVVQLDFADGRSQDLRIAKFDIAEGLAIEMDAISQRPAQFTDSASVAESGSGIAAQVVKDSDAVRTFVYDTPLLRDADADPNRLTASTYYWQSGFADNTYNGGNLYLALDAINYGFAGELANETPWGSTVNALGDPVDGAVFQTDLTNTLTIRPVVGSDRFASITNTELLLGLNALLIAKRNGEVEVIQFQNVTDNGDGSLTLDTLLRGRRGTDTMAFNHTPGETFLYLSDFTGDRYGLTLDFADGVSQTFWKGIGAGQLFQEGDNIVLTSEARSLKPYAPVNYTATVNGSDIDLTWDRRTRYSGQLRDTHGEVPLNEDTEEYEIEIYDGPAGTLLRTVTGVTAETYKYLSADITTDFGALPTTLTFKVYQISAQVGRGFSYEETVDVL